MPALDKGVLSMNGVCAALGFFDGVHTAHCEIMRATAALAEKNTLTPIALTFDASPSELLVGGFDEYITDNAQKTELLAKIGVKMRMLPLNTDILNKSPEEFVRDILVGTYNVKYVVCGYNYKFGKNAAGDTALLHSLGQKYGFGVKVLPCVFINGEAVSSSNIRQKISHGDISGANSLLGRPFSISGTVVGGQKLGRTLGFPTANIAYPPKTVQPRAGVYKTFFYANGVRYSAVTNAGVRPTVDGKLFKTESHLCGFSGNLYGKTVKLEFIDFIREEIKFQSTNELRKQVLKDIKKTEEAL